jgi:hypothetical protein
MKRQTEQRLRRKAWQQERRNARQYRNLLQWEFV